jgi:hypothetical protein
VFAKRFHSDCTVIDVELRGDCAAFVELLRCVGATIADCAVINMRLQRLCSNSAVIAKRLRGNHLVIAICFAQPLRSDCAGIAQ